MPQEQQELNKKELIERIFDSLHLIILHYGIWFRETEHQLGLDKAIRADDIVWKRILPIILKRVTGTLNIPAENGIPEFLTNATAEKLERILSDMGKNWLANDGVWFQAVENNFDDQMFHAKRINDSCWVRFSYLEAKTIMKRLNLPENGGIPALKEALKYRQYALVNQQETIDVAEDRIIFRMNDCRVQSARKRANLPDYPCKSAGVVEYSRFAEGIDPRIKTTCIGCPPDPHPDEWYCAWDFSLKEAIK